MAELSGLRQPAGPLGTSEVAFSPLGSRSQTSGGLVTSPTDSCMWFSECDPRAGDGQLVQLDVARADVVRSLRHTLVWGGRQTLCTLVCPWEAQ